MSDLDILKRKVSDIEKYLAIVAKYQHLSKKEILNDETVQGAVERYLYVLCQTTIDFAEALVAFYKLRTPGNYGEIFEILEENKIITKDISFKMKKMTGFRNILAHAYGEVNQDIVYEVFKKDINDIKDFVKDTAKLLH